MDKPKSLSIGFLTTTDTYTVSATNGNIVDCSDSPVSQFALQVKGTGAAPTTLTLVLEGSLDGTNFTTLISAAETDNGAVKWTADKPVKYFRTRCQALTLGSATAVVANAIGM